ncbi:MAG: DarT ssDNA thymidine ADP-ribosyltransferase family protein [Terriglobales bacterium]|jgi:ssDNA thymidine ADP-ribosyltransferase DarT-like protein
MADKDPFLRYGVTAFYHFTDRRNLPAIQEHGGLYSLAKLRERKIDVPAPGGNDWSHQADERVGLDRYVHLCFRANHPMLFRAMQDARIAVPIYLEIHPDVIRVDGVMYTDDVSNKAGVEIRTLDRARQTVDFEVLYTRTNWKDPEIQRRLQQVEKCELLIPDHIPLDLIRNFPHG